MNNRKSLIPTLSPRSVAVLSLPGFFIAALVVFVSWHSWQPELRGSSGPDWVAMLALAAGVFFTFSSIPLLVVAALALMRRFAESRP